MLGVTSLMTSLSLLVDKNEVPAACNKAADAVEKMGKKIGKAETAVGQLAGAFTGMVAASWIEKGLSALVKPAADLELGMLNLAQVTGANSEALGVYKARAIEIATKTTFTTQQMVDSMIHLRNVTGSADAAMTALGPTAQIAMASFGKVSIEKSTEMMGELIRNFSLTGEQIPHVAEKIAAGTRAMGLQIGDVSKVMGRLSLAALQGGQSFDEIFKAMLLAKQAIPSQEMAATALMRVMSAFSDTKKKTLLESIGVFPAIEGKIRPMSAIMLDLADRWSTGGDSIRGTLKKTFGDRGILPILAILEKLTNGVRDNEGHVHKMGGAYDFLNDKMTTNKGVLQAMSDAFMGSAIGKQEMAKESLVNLATAMGQVLLPSVMAVADGINKLASVFRELFQAPFIGSILGGVLKFGGAIAVVWGLVAAVDGFKRLIVTVHGNVIAAVGSMKSLGASANTAAVGMTNAARAASVLNKVTGGIAGAAGGAAKKLGAFAVGMGPLGWAIAIYTFWDEIKAGWNWLEKRGSDAQATIKAALKSNGATDDTAQLVSNKAMANIHPLLGLFTKGKGSFGEQMGDMAGGLLPGVGIGKGLRAQLASIQAETARLQAGAEAKAAAHSNKMAEIMRESGKQLYHYLYLGSEEMKSAMKEIKSAIDYKPKVTDWNAFQQLRAAVDKGLKGKELQGTDRKKALGMIGAMNTIADLGKKRQKRALSGNEQTELAQASAMTLAGAEGLSLLHPNVVAPSLAGKFEKKFIKPELDSTSEAGMAWSKNWQRLGGGETPTGKIPGWMGALGDVTGFAALKAGVTPKGFGYTARSLPGQTPEEAAAWKKSGLPDFETWKKRRMASDPDEVKKTNEFGKAVVIGLRELFSKTLNVKIVEGEKHDPTAGGGGSSFGGVMSDILGGILGS